MSDQTPPAALHCTFATQKAPEGLKMALDIEGQLAERLMLKVTALKEQAIRDYLVGLGWTPPEGEDKPQPARYCWECRWYCNGYECRRRAPIALERKLEGGISYVHGVWPHVDQGTSCGDWEGKE